MSQLAQGETTIEGPTTQTRALVRREALPQELTSLGIAAFADGETGKLTLKIPDELKAKANVLMPVEIVQQDDPNWRPSLRVVRLDPDAKNGAHFYPQAGGKLAPRKQALELLADAAGVVSVRTSLSGRERVVVGDVTAETFTHMAVLKIRKSDGTLRTLEASRTYEPFAEYEEVLDAVANADEWQNGSKTGKKRYPFGTPEYQAEARKRWLNEIKFAKAKNESKAILRAVRAALQIPHTVSPQRAALPWVVVGWNLSPQDTPEVRQAIASLYGTAPGDAIPVRDDWVGHELTEGVDEPLEPPVWEEVTPEEMAELTDVVVNQDSSAPDGGVREPAPEPTADEQGPEEGTDDGPPAPTPSDVAEPMIPGLEPDPDPAPEDAGGDGLSEAERAEVTAFGAAKPPAGAHQTKTMKFLFSLGEPADEHLNWLLRTCTKPKDAEFHRLLVLACRVHRPELYEAWKAEQA